MKKQGVSKVIFVNEDCVIDGDDDYDVGKDEEQVWLFCPEVLKGRFGVVEFGGGVRDVVVDGLVVGGFEGRVRLERVGERCCYVCGDGFVVGEMGMGGEGVLKGGLGGEVCLECLESGIECGMLCVVGGGGDKMKVLEGVLRKLVGKFVEVFGGSAVGGDGLVAAGNSLGSLPDLDSLNLFPEPKRVVVDMMVSAKYILPMFPHSKVVLENHALVVNGDEIVAILSVSAAENKYAPRHRTSRPNHVLLPGFVNTHTHTGLTLLRGCADDQPLLAWLHKTIWPVENEFIKEEGFCYDGALLSAAEMIRGGVTTFADMYWFSDAACRAVMDCGIRASIGMILIGFPSTYAASEDEYLNHGHDIFERYESHANLHFTYSPHAPYTVSDATWERIGGLAKDKSIPIHTHLHETIEECHASESLMTSSPCCHQSLHKMRPLANFHRMGLLDQHLLAAHMVHLNDEEMILLASKKESVHISHCPSSNAKLASGFAPIAKLLSHGVNVALGTDSAASNNSLDILSEMKFAALTAKNVAQDPTAVPAQVALEMATVNGGKALGLKIGALREGWKADLVCMEVGTHERNSPYFDLCSALVYSSSREDVTDVWIGGKRVLKDGKHVTIDAKDVANRAAKWKAKISGYIKEMREKELKVAN